MRINRKGKWIIGILFVIIMLGFLIPLGKRYSGHQSESVSTVPTEITTPEETSMQTVTPSPMETETSATLETLLGEDYVQFLTEIITMQMGNRMDKDPDVQYYPIKDNAPLSNYVTIGEETQFEVDKDGYLIILLPEGSVTSAEHGVQRFRIQQINSKDY